MIDSHNSSRKAHILVVEDDLDTCRTWIDLLESWGYTVRVASDGEEALQSATVQRPQAIMLDLGLPKMDGFEVARRLREQYGPELIMIAMTGRSQPLDRIACTEAGINMHFGKPADPEAVRVALSRLISGGD